MKKILTITQMTARLVISRAMKILIPVCQLLDVSSPSRSLSGHWVLHRTPGNHVHVYKSLAVN